MKRKQVYEMSYEKLDEALELIWKVFEEFEAPEYSEEGIDEFRRYIAVSSIKEMLDDGKMSMWYCKHGNKVIGVIATAPADHVSLFFVDKEYHGQGIGKALYKQVLEKNKAVYGCKKITVNSSPYAKGIYEKLGFVQTDGEQVKNGIRFLPMEHVIS